MPRKLMTRGALGLLMLGVLGLASASAQDARPEGRPFSGAKLDVTQPAAEGVAIRAGHMFDSNAGTMLTNQVILIQGDKITEVGPAASVRIPAGARVIDLSQATVLPGLIDRHVHCFSTGANQAQRVINGWNTCLADMLGGFTTVQDMGSVDYSSVTVRDAIDKGNLMGPRMQVAGPQINPRASSYYQAPSEYAPFGEGGLLQLQQNINSPWLARAAVREHSHYGTDWIKIYLTEDYEGSGYKGAFRPDGTMINVPSLTLEEVQAIVDEAHRRGLKTITHAYGGEGLRVALAANVDVPMHAAVGVTGAAGLDDETIRMFKVPLPNGKQRPVIQTLWDLIGGMEKADMAESGGKTTRFKLTELSFKKLVASGVKEMFGSGVYGNAHGWQAMQFPIYVKWGMTPAQAIQVATSWAAEGLNYDLPKYVGSIDKGKYADVIAVSGDPLADISELERVKFVMKGGAVYKNEMIAKRGGT